MGIYYSLQRLCKARMFSDALSWINFWGWQRDHRGRRHHAAAGPHHQQGIRRTGVADRHRHRRGLGGLHGQPVRHHRQAAREAHVCGDLVLHRHGASPWPCCTSSTRWRCPASLFKSYSIYAGVQDALVQWWYGHNAVAFFLTTPYLGLMYYFLPKAAEPPGVLLPALDHPFLGADLHLHLGRAASPALHRAAGLGAIARHGVLA